MFAFEPSDNMTSREIINQARYPSPSLLLSEPEKTAPALGGWHRDKKLLRNLEGGQKGPGGYFLVSINCMPFFAPVIFKQNLNIYNKHADTLWYSVSTSVEFSLRTQGNFAPPKRLTLLFHCNAISFLKTRVIRVRSSQNLVAWSSQSTELEMW